MRPESLARLALTFLAVLLITLGLLAVGGPRMGRMEKRDLVRMSDLQTLSAQVTCVAATTGNGLSDRFETEPPCAGLLRRKDPYTGEPYRYERLSESAFRLCAAFEAPGHLTGWQARTLDPESGCLIFEYQP